VRGWIIRRRDGGQRQAARRRRRREKPETPEDATAVNDPEETEQPEEDVTGGDSEPPTGDENDAADAGTAAAAAAAAQEAPTKQPTSTEAADDEKKPEDQDKPATDATTNVDKFASTHSLTEAPAVGDEEEVREIPSSDDSVMKAVIAMEEEAAFFAESSLGLLSSQKDIFSSIVNDSDLASQGLRRTASVASLSSVDSDINYPSSKSTAGRTAGDLSARPDSKRGRGGRGQSQPQSRGRGASLKVSELDASAFTRTPTRPVATAPPPRREKKSVSNTQCS